MHHKILHPNIEFAFYHLGGVAPKKGLKVKKVDPETKKTTLKLEEREFAKSYDRNSCVRH